jgi:predicted nucleic acid-binding protein
MYLVGTNIFLEILLAQAKKEPCKEFLDTYAASVFISDFSLHSIGVLAFRTGQDAVFKDFLQDLFPHCDIATLSRTGYAQLPYVKQHFRLDFDDAYQYQIAKEHALEIVTLDSDFTRVQNAISVLFL